MKRDDNPKTESLSSSSKEASDWKECDSSYSSENEEKGEERK